MLGIVPQFVHEPTSFLRPIVNELMEFWNQGVRFYTAVAEKQVSFQNSIDVHCM